MPAFFSKKLLFFVQKSTFTQSNNVAAVLVLFSVFIRKKVTITENITFADYISGIRPPDCSKLTKNPKNDSNVTISRHEVIVKFFWRCIVSLAKFSYWSKSHANVITGSGIMIIFFVRDWSEIRKSEIPRSEFCPISRDWSELWIPNFARISLTKKYLML